ncbi:hypothetical protein [Curtobacterium sp. ME26]|uniref:hypothetical protein n=1 Tax=Curtobacterium sp. ME26 TaxID=2744254 RepID=UPI0015F6E014|nr:hypothetical protein [Curtobacterium sp. ME26]
MRKITRAAAGTALGLVLTSSGFVAATAAHADTDLPAIPGASAERPIPDSFTGFSEIQGAPSTSERDGLSVFGADRSNPSIAVTSSVTKGRLEVVDQRGRLLCSGSSAPANAHLYSCDLAAIPSGPQVITAAVVKPNGHYSEPDQALLDAYAAAPVVTATERKGDDLVLRGNANRGIRVEASLDRKEIIASGDAGTDGRFEVRVPGGASAKQVALRAVNDDVPASTPDHDHFAVSGWTDVTPATGGEQPGEGQSPVEAVTNLHDGDTVDTAEPVFEGTARPNGRVRIDTGSLSGLAIGIATADEHGNWSTKASFLRPGDNALSVSYERPDGTWRTAQSLLVHYVPKVDRFTVQTPANGSTVTEARPKITGAGAHAYSPVDLQTADSYRPMGHARTDASGEFVLDVSEDLKPGVNELTASYQDLNGKWKTESYTLTYDDGKGGEQPGDGNGGEQPGDGNEGGQPGDGGTEEPGDGASDTAFSADALRVSDRQVDVGVHGPKGTEVTVSANGESKKVTLGDTDYGNTLITAPKKLTTTVTVTATIAGEQVERTLTIGNGDHAADALEAEVTSTSALLGSAKITVWGLPSGIGGLQAREGDRTLATGVIKDDGEGSISVSGLMKGDHVITLVSGGKQTQVSVHI